MAKNGSLFGSDTPQTGRQARPRKVILWGQKGEIHMYLLVLGSFWKVEIFWFFSKNLPRMTIAHRTPQKSILPETRSSLNSKYRVKKKFSTLAKKKLFEKKFYH